MSKIEICIFPNSSGDFSVMKTGNGVILLGYMNKDGTFFNNPEASEAKYKPKSYREAIGVIKSKFKIVEPKNCPYIRCGHKCKHFIVQPLNICNKK